MYAPMTFALKEKVVVLINGEPVDGGLDDKMIMKYPNNC